MTGRAQALIQEMVPPLLTPLTGEVGEDGKPVINLAALLDMLSSLQQQVDQIPALIQQARQQVLDQLLGGAGAAFDTFRELQERFATDETAATALAAKVGALEQLLAAGVVTPQQLTQGLAAKLSRTGDTSTGQQIGPNGMTSDAYITNQQVALGVKRPIPFASNIGATPVALDSLTDPLGLNRKALVLKINLWMLTAATLAATVKVGTTPGGSDVLNKTYLLTGLPGLNTLLELAPPPFLLLPAGTTLYVTANSGKWACAVDTLYVTGL